MSLNHTPLLKGFLTNTALSSAEGYTYLWESKHKQTFCFATTDMDNMATKAEELARHKNVYMPIALFPKALGNRERGKADDASHLIGFFGDIDTLEKPDPNGKSYPTDKATALKIIKEISLTPTYINDSGYGLHVLWLFPTPLKIKDANHRNELKALYKRFQQMLQQHFSNHGYELDSVGDLVRVFRIPGTFNHRNPDNPAPVSIIEHNPEALYNIERIIVHLDRHAPEKTQAPRKQGKKFPEADVELIQQGCGWFTHCIDDAAELSETQWYAMLSIVGHCKEGNKLAHEYSQSYPDYNPHKTDTKLRQALTTAGPRTCKDIRDNQDGEPYCAQCPHWGTVTSPIQIGQPNEAGSIKTQLLASADRQEYWHTKNRQAYVTITKDGHKENLPLRGDRFYQWLTHRIIEQHDKIPTKQAIEEVVSVLEARANFKGEQRDIFHRIAYHNGFLYIDLGTDDWTAIEVRPDGWDIIPQAPVRFVRSDSVQPLPNPSREGNIMLLRDYIPCDSDDDLKLIIGLLLGIYAPRHPYPVGVFTGLQGCGKSTRARAIIAITDPSSAPMVSAPREERDVFASVASRWLTSFDNVKKVKDNVSDALCAVSTGISHASRKYFTNLSVFETMEIARPVLMTGIELRLRQDLRSRSIFFEFSLLKARDCKTEKEYWEKYQHDAPHILGGVLDALSCALRNWEQTEKVMRGQEMPRLADHTVWVSAAEEALGWKPGTYRGVLITHQKDGMAESDMNSTFGQVMLGYLRYIAEPKQNPRLWSVKGLYTDLTKWSEKNASKEERQYMPQSLEAFSKKLHRTAPSLGYMGVEFELGINHKGNKRAIRITFSDEFLNELPAPDF